MTPREQVLANGDTMTQLILTVGAVACILYCVVMKIRNGNDITAAVIFFAGCFLIGSFWVFDLWWIIGDIASSDTVNLR